MPNDEYNPVYPLDTRMSEDDKAKLNKLVQEIAWDTVTHHPLTGLMKPVTAK